MRVLSNTVFLHGCCSLDVDIAWGRQTDYLESDRNDCFSVNFMYSMHILTQVTELVDTIYSQLYVSPPQLCYTLNSTAGMLSSAGDSCRAALGSINFIAYFYNLSLCMHPLPHPITSALTVHTAVKFCVSPCFMVTWSFSHTRFLYWLLYLFDIFYICVCLVHYLLWVILLALFIDVIFTKGGLCRSLSR